ncbi:hypothetical protein CJU90_2900 [Yarrowia sp. C11]|nr:hypothetical protein CKK34_4347 [Yarrowia sp. E02]KAG5369447.1 hypothetical protein CJU90_2900 [Yarrowia sp. C11]
MGLANEPPEYVYFTYASHKIQISFDPEDSKKEKDPQAGVTVGFLRERVRIFIQDDQRSQRQARIKAKEEKEEAERKANLGKGKSRPVKKKGKGKGQKPENGVQEGSQSDSTDSQARSNKVDEVYAPVLLSQVILIHGGKKLQDNSKPLAACGVKTGDLITVLLKQQEYKPPPTVTANAPSTPPKVKLTPKQQIDKTLKDTETELGPLITKYIDESKTGTVGSVAPKEQHRRLCEMVLQRQFTLDDVETNGDPEIRALRKQAVNKMHEYHESLDEALKRFEKDAPKGK